VDAVKDAVKDPRHRQITGRVINNTITAAAAPACLALLASPPPTKKTATEDRATPIAASSIETRFPEIREIPAPMVGW
jgi:hypothetical protein